MFLGFKSHLQFIFCDSWLTSCSVIRTFLLFSRSCFCNEDILFMICSLFLVSLLNFSTVFMGFLPAENSWCLRHWSFQFVLRQVLLSASLEAPHEVFMCHSLAEGATFVLTLFPFLFIFKIPHWHLHWYCQKPRNSLSFLEGKTVCLRARMGVHVCISLC